MWSRRRLISAMLAAGAAGAASACTFGQDEPVATGTRAKPTAGESPTGQTTTGQQTPQSPGTQSTTTLLPSPAGQVELRARVARAESELIEAYGAAIAAHPQLASSLAGFRDHHRAHLAEVDPASATLAGPTQPPATLTATAASPNETARQGETASPNPAADPRELDRAVGALIKLERRAAKARVRDCDAAPDPLLARVLCLIAASEAQHVRVLRRDRSQLAAGASN